MVAYGVLTPEEKRHPLDCFFKPRSVAVIGASERPASVGRTLLWNLISSPFGGTVYPVNPHHERVLGIRTLKSVLDAPEPIDLALIITPASTVPAMLDACIEAKVQGAIIISADYSQDGGPLLGLSDEIRGRVSSHAIRIIGPNSLGVMNPIIGLNAAYASTIALKGTVGFISQSGALCASILDWSLQVKMGFSAFVSFGQMMDVGWSEVIYYLGSDPNTKSIVIYMESLGNARAFLSAAREVALTKPIIILKTGRNRTETSDPNQPAYFEFSDTENDDLLSAALARSGVLRVSGVEKLFSMADALAKQPRPRGPRLTIISNAAGPGVLAVDALTAEGGEPARLSDSTQQALTQFLPPFWKVSNPIDLLPDATPERYKNAVQAALQDANSDGLLVLLAPQVATKPTETAQTIVSLCPFGQKPVLASWMGGDLVEKGMAILNEYKVPTFPYPDQAAAIFAAMWRYSYAIRGLYETPEPLFGSEPGSNQVEEASRLIATVRESGRIRLTETEVKKVLAAHGIPVAQTVPFHTVEEALRLAEVLGYPVHVEVELQEPFRPGRPEFNYIHNKEELRTFVEKQMKQFANPSQLSFSMFSLGYPRGHTLMLAARTDAQFGPYLVFGAGGSFAEVIHDYAYALPPLNSTLARRALERTKIFTALCDTQQGTSPNLAPLEQTLIQFSNLILKERWIRTLEINPLLFAENHVLALSARAELYDREVSADQLPQPAIRPYPVEYCTSCILKDGSHITLRVVRPEDESLLVKFNETLSSETVYFHYLQLLSLDQRIRHERISQMCCIDYDRQIGLVAEHHNRQTGEKAIRGLARLVRIHGSNAGEFAIVVSDLFQRRGLGRRLLKHLLDVAAQEGISPVVGIIHPENQTMLNLCRSLGFKLTKPPGDIVRAEYFTKSNP